MDKLRQSVSSFMSLEDLITDGSSQMYHKVVSSMHDLCFNILEAEKNGIDRGKIEDVIEPAREIHGRSVFVKRLQEWPRDYPGDFETIEYLCDLDNRSTYGKIEYYIEDYALNSAMAQQHRNKLLRQAGIVLDTLYNANSRKKILSVGCGGCRDIAMIEKYIRDVECDIVLHDIDRDALGLSKERLANLVAQVHVVEGNFLQSMREVEKMGPFDLIMSGGFFDYLSDKHISFFLKSTVRKLLNSDGKLFFTNIKEGNHFKVWQEYLADWKLIYRNQEDIMKLLSTAGFPDESIQLEMDETGLTFLVTVSK